jgi:hypothetical protein
MSIWLSFLSSSSVVVLEASESLQLGGSREQTERNLSTAMCGKK